MVYHKIKDLNCHKIIDEKVTEGPRCLFSKKMIKEVLYILYNIAKLSNYPLMERPTTLYICIQLIKGQHGFNTCLCVIGNNFCYILNRFIYTTMNQMIIVLRLAMNIV